MATASQVILESNPEQQINYGSGTGTNQTETGLPTQDATASMAPLPVQSFGALPSISPSYSTGGLAVGPNAASAAMTDPNQSDSYMKQAYGENAAALAPTFAKQASDLQDSSAARGISSSGAAGQLQTQLQSQQASALAAADEPITSQGFGYHQADLSQNTANKQAVNLANQSAAIGTGEFNSEQAQGNSQFNAGVGNTAAQENANYYAGALGTNESNYNDYLKTQEQQGYNTSNEELQAYLNSFLPNSGVENSITGAQSAGTTGYNTAYQDQVSGQNAVLGAAGAAAGGFSSGGTVSPGLGNIDNVTTGTGAYEGTGEYGGGN